MKETDPDTVAEVHLSSGQGGSVMLIEQAKWGEEIVIGV